MDVGRWSTWDRGLKNARADEPLAEGVAGTLTPLSGPDAKFVVTAFDEKRMYTFETSLPLARLAVKRSIVSTQPDRTAFRHEVTFRGALGWFWSLVLGGDFMTALPPTMHELAALAERRGAPQ